MLIPLDELRDRLQGRLGADFSERLWDLLLDEGHPQEVTGGYQDFEYLVAKALQHLRVRRQPQPGLLLTGRIDPGDRLRAVAIVQASHAASDPEVTAFRRRVRAPIAPDGVSEWVQAQSNADGTPTQLLEIPIGPAQRLEQRRGSIVLRGPSPRLRPVVGLHTRQLEYVVPGDSFIHRQSVALGGVLDDLRVLSDALHRRYGWLPAQGATFVLTSIPPIAPPVWMVPADTLTPRYLFDLDIRISPSSLMAAHRTARAGLGVSRQKWPSVKRLRLAAFAASRPPGETWAQRMAAWNEAMPDHQYTDRRRFSREARTAIAQLLGEDQ